MRNKPCPHCGTTTGQHKADCLLVRQFCGEVATPTPSPAPSASPHQGADALREAAQALVDANDAALRWGQIIPAVENLRAALAQHQAPQQGEQHGK